MSIPVHVGTNPPSHWDEIEANQQRLGEEASDWLREQRRPSAASGDLDWGGLGFEPRWVGFDAADCVAALDPSVYAGKGADEFDRFRQGAASRGELAIVISLVETPDPGSHWSVFGPAGSSLSLGRFNTSIHSRPLGIGARVRRSDGVEGAEVQLALRLMSCNPPLPWSALSLDGITLSSTHGRVKHEPEGTLVPIIETELGEPVVAVWTSPDGVERRYVVPAEAPWTVLLSWLVEDALPEYVPDAMRRARRHMATDLDLMTRRERQAHTALAAFDAEYAERRGTLDSELQSAQSDASALRDGLLFGTGDALVETVRTVLEWAGMNVVPLDEELGGTKNADLLCTLDGRSVLVEVKSASGVPKESVYDDVLRHLRVWEKLPDSTPVEGGVLVINHQHRLPPHERRTKAFERPEFLAAQTEPVVTTLELFEAWREEDRVATCRLLFGPSATTVPNTTPSVPQRQPETRRRGLFRRG
ncbi:hypothetical protein FHP29_18135 [Nocardioides albidus]|uniref:Uncharacterized protein n=1 Tax=Nocardioides albidus TaxID=1517589 RepID=A0A5C4VPG7_9ACTN|nr:hypothetical protein [Nocardioides albidus]TNM37702.1 hypothetical protein FHP29_18135 [Nocardioides albidus]